MAILSLARDYGVNPCIVRMTTDNDYATITTAGYLSTQMAAYNHINGGLFQWVTTDMVLAYFNGTWGFFTISTDFSSLIPFSTGLPVGVASSVLVTNAAGAALWDGPLTDGQVVIGSSGATPVVAAITGGAGITVTNGAGTITISGTGGGIAWTGIAGTTQSASVNNGYVVQNASQTTITLPTTFAIGDIIAIKGLGVAGWILQAAGGDVIDVGQLQTSAGGTVTSAANYDVIYVSGLVANTEWSMDSSVTTGFNVL